MIITYTIKEQNSKKEFDFFFSKDFASKQTVFSEQTFDLSFLNINVTVKDLKYQLYKCSIKYEVLDSQLLSIIEADLMHIAKIYSQCSYTLRKKSFIRDYNYVLFKDKMQNIKNAMIFLATLSSIPTFNIFNKRVYSIYMKTEKERVYSIVNNICVDNLPKGVKQDVITQITEDIAKEILTRMKISVFEYSDLDIENAAIQLLERERVENIADDALKTVINDNIKINTNIAKHHNSNNRQNYFFSEDAILNIAKAHNISLSKSAAKKINEKINCYDNRFRTLSEYERMVIDSINAHEEKIFKSKLQSCLKNNLSKAGFQWAVIGQDLIEEYYEFIMKNILTAPQSFFDETAAAFFKQINSNKENNDNNIVESSANLSFREIVDKIPTVNNDYEVDVVSDNIDPKILQQVTQLLDTEKEHLIDGNYNKALQIALNFIETKDENKKDELCNDLSYFLKDCNIPFSKVVKLVLEISKI